MQLIYDNHTEKRTDKQDFYRFEYKMWQKLTDKEKREIEEKEVAYFKQTRLKKALILALSMFAIILTIEIISAVSNGIKQGGRLDPLPRSPIEWKEVPAHLPDFIKLPIFTGLILFFLYYRFGYIKMISKTQICDNCFKTQKYSDNIVCDCGGRLDFLYNYKWIEETDDLTPDK